MKVNLDLAGINSDNDIADELKTDVGSSAFDLAHDRFFGTAALLRIWTGVGEAGVQLVLNTDYTMQGLDSDLTAEAIAQVWSQVKIENVAYQTGNLYFNYHAVADEVKIEKMSFTPIGGLAIKVTNETGFDTIAGQLVKTDPATDDAVILAAAGDTECIGVFLDSGIADGSEAWVVVNGIADVALDDNVAAVRGNWMATGVLAGYARTSASPAASPQHFEEIGHCIESVSAGGGGTHILARCVLHFL